MEKSIKGTMRSATVWLLVLSFVLGSFTMMGQATTTAANKTATTNKTTTTTNSTTKILTKDATGKTDRLLGVVMRKKANSSSAKITRIPNNSDLTICSVTFVKKNNYSRKKRWFYVKYKNFKGYVPVTQVDNVRYNYVIGTAKNNLYYRKGAGYSMKKAGILKKGAKIQLCLLSYAKDSKVLWYRFRKNSTFYFVSSKDLNATVMPYTKSTSSTTSNTTSSGTTNTSKNNTSASSSTGLKTDTANESTDKDQDDKTTIKVDATKLQSNSKPMQMTMPSSTLTAWYNALLKVAGKIEKNNLKYNMSGGGTTYKTGLKSKKVNCANFISWAMQEADFENSGFSFYLGNAKIYDQNIPKNYFVNSPDYLVQTGLNMSIKDAVNKGYLKPGDIVGKKSGYHTMVYKHTKNGKYYFFSVGTNSVAKKIIKENAYSASYKIGVIIRRVAD